MTRVRQVAARAMLVALVAALGLVVDVAPAAAAPTAVAVSPTAATNNGTANLTVTGTGFEPGAQITLVRTATEGSPIAATGEAVTGGGTQLTGTINLTAHAPAPWNLVVTNPDATSSTIANGFTIGAAGTPSITSPSQANPATVFAGNNGQMILLNGANLYRSPTVAVQDADPVRPDVTVASRQFGPAGDGSQYTITVDAPMAQTVKLGRHDIVFTNTNGNQVVCGQCANVVDTSPVTVTSVDPASRGQGFTGTVAVNGTGFSSAPGNPTVSFGAGITVNGVQRDSDVRLTVSVTVAPDAATGNRNVTVTVGGASGSRTNGFMVVAGPKPTGTNSPQANNGTGKPIRVTGTDFPGSGTSGSAQVTLVRSGFPSIDVSSESTTQGDPGPVPPATNDTIDGVADLDLAPPGAYDVVVTDPAAGGVGRFANGFTVTASAPTVTSVTPSSLTQTGTTTVTVNGTNFARGLTVAFGDGITAGAPQSITATSFTVLVTVQGGATPGPRTVRVTNADTQPATCTCFTVVQRRPENEDVALVSATAGQLTLLSRAPDGGLRVRNRDGSTWGPTTSLGGIMVGPPSAASRASGTIDVFVRGTDDALWHIRFNGSTWGDYSRIGGILRAAPAATSASPGTLSVFVRGADDALWTIEFNGATWGTFSRLGGILRSAPAAASAATGVIDVFVRGADDALWTGRVQGTFSGFTSLGGGLSSSPAAGTLRDGSVDTFVRGTDNQLYGKRIAGGTPGPFVNLGGLLAGGAATASASATTLTVIVRGTDNFFYVNERTGTTWSGFSLVPPA